MEPTTALNILHANHRTLIPWGQVPTAICSSGVHEECQ